ncbi:sodium:solute symporter family protein [Gimesia sp.]|uniref:sodium:solute symporter family protein n=1 Tax=Gimesia sp. TaxID=2024833 RepID=UPI003A92F416
MLLEAEKNTWLGLHTADWIILALYFVVILAIGLWSVRKVKDMADFFMGGRRFGKVFMMFFAFGSGTSSEQAISVVAGTWRAGLAGIWWQFLWLWATPFYWIVAPLMRRMRALTTADFFETRFNGPTAVMYSFYGIAISITFIAGGLFGTGKMVDALTGNELDRLSVEANIMVPAAEWDTTEKTFHITERRLQGYEFAILAVTVMFVIYGMAGGLGAAIITDFIQGILTIVFSFLLLPFVFFEIGGFGMLHQQSDLKKGMLDLTVSPELAATMGEPITPFYVCMLSITALAGIVIQPHIMGVCGAGKTEYEGRFGFTVGNFLKRFCTVAWTFTGLACIVWYMGDNSPLKTSPDPADQAVYQSLMLRASPEYDQLSDEEKAKVETTDKNFADKLFGMAAHDILPRIAPGLIGLLLASLLAAVMSTSDAQMIISSGLFTENIYRKCIAKNKSQRHYLWVGRVAGLVIVILALILQTTFTDIIDALKIIVKTPACIGISLWLGIIWRRWNVISVWVSTITGIVVWTFVAFHADTLYSSGLLPESMFKSATEMKDVWQMFCFMSLAILSGIIVSFLTPRQSQEKLDHFFKLMHTPVKLNEVIDSPCTLPAEPEPMGRKMFPNSKDIEIPRPTFQDLAGFALAWVAVAAIIFLTQFLAKVA